MDKISTKNNCLKPMGRLFRQMELIVKSIDFKVMF
jgi:hypothetical protein